MPEVGVSALVIGNVTPEASQLTGIPQGVPVINGCADHAATSLGAGVVRGGDVSAIIGTAGVISVLSDQPMPDRENGSVCWNYCLDNKWINLGIMQTAGECLNWFKRAFDEDGDSNVFDLYNQEASKIPEGSASLIFLPYLNGERNPYWDANARGVFFGAQPGTPEIPLCSRRLWKVWSFALRNNLELIESLGVEIKELRLLGGAAKALYGENLAKILNKRINTVRWRNGGVGQLHSLRAGFRGF